MSTEQNKALVQKFEELINTKDIDTALTLFSSDYVDHTPSVGLPPGIEGVRAFHSMMFAAFPDRHVTSSEMIAEDDKVVHRLRGELTHKGAFMGMPPTGKRIHWSCIDIWRIADGKIVEHWVEVDMLGMMQQLGLIPSVPAQ
jgi:steroid delta-isomerase-like uncharacterized protein